MRNQFFQAYAEYYYPYNKETDCFEVPYMTVTKDELQEMVCVVGEVYGIYL